MDNICGHVRQLIVNNVYFVIKLSIQKLYRLQAHKLHYKTAEYSGQ